MHKAVNVRGFFFFRGLGHTDAATVALLPYHLQSSGRCSPTGRKRKSGEGWRATHPDGTAKASLSLLGWRADERGIGAGRRIECVCTFSGGQITTEASFSNAIPCFFATFFPFFLLSSFFYNNGARLVISDGCSFV